MSYADAAEWMTSIGPLMVPLVASWLEQRGMRRELQALRRELRELEQDHLSRLVELELRLSKVETAISSLVAA
jgi:uncharacterized coiled-coil protein SlyX